MNARVCLLVLVTGLFMAVWNGDQAAIDAALARRAVAQSRLLAATGTPPAASAALDQNDGASSAVAAQSASAATLANGVPLPAGIPKGEYQAVSQTGRTVRVLVRENAGSDRPDPRDIYISDGADGTRWYLVRVQADSSL